MKEVYCMYVCMYVCRDAMEKNKKYLVELRDQIKSNHSKVIEREEEKKIILDQNKVLQVDQIIMYACTVCMYVCMYVCLLYLLFIIFIGYYMKRAM